ncbi:hypothetical protein J0383_02515 [Flavobacterium endoglycinae]|uniref:Uncharacterized protein n=1 Tax=Flavobacterium endoglycinae TaxID=2816357 RepID=A0ABX7QH40_9FLAO|nr:hypothetical protein [Flavobacterium endoglycinae]QSW89696.1 hypothetical protein J0383_02515 [Flavobacterium endoglycinae]
MEATKNTGKTKTIISILVFIGIIWYFLGGGLDSQVATNMQTIENQVALDAEKQYEIAKNGGDKIQTYVQAGMVAAAYLQAKDEVNYNKWKAIEKEEAKNAGMTIE